MEEMIIAFNPDFTLKDYEYMIISFYLDKYEHRVLLTAKKLGIGKSTLFRFIQEHPELNKKFARSIDELT